MSEWTAGGSGVKFEEIGDKVAGTITFCDIVNGTDLKGQPSRQKVLDIQSDEGEDQRLYVKKGNMEAELAKALKAHGLDAPVVGDRIAVALVATKPSKTAGFNPAKVYEVAYKRVERATAGATSAADLI